MAGLCGLTATQTALQKKVSNFLVERIDRLAALIQESFQSEMRRPSRARRVNRSEGVQ